MRLGTRGATPIAAADAPGRVARLAALAIVVGATAAVAAGLAWRGAGSQAAAADLGAILVGRSRKAPCR